ncbi:MAG: hypothetical protein COA38_10360 [Fluviicola sp.]|nr:MAG: hypothetical protein COA38_10360 [Fluviicola sp.]
MRAIKIYILEDEIITQRLLKKYLQGLGYVVCGITNSAEIALEEIALLKPDIALLDINVKGIKTGIWVGEQLTVPFVYISAYNDSETIKSAVKTAPVGYLIKPFKEMEVFAIIEMTVNNLINEESTSNKNDEQKEVIIKDGKTHIKVRVNEIFFVKSEGKYIEVYLKNRRIVIRQSLIGFMDRIKIPFIIRVHGSYLINLNMLESFDTSFILIRGFTVPISRRYKKQFVAKMKVI